MNRIQAATVPARRRADLAAFVPALVAVGALAAFLGGIRSGERSGAAPPRDRREDAPASARAVREEGPAVPAPFAARAPAPAGAAPYAAPAREAAPLAAAPSPALLTRDGRATPALVAKVTAEARRALEAARAGFAERCVPPERREGATFTFNVTFDARGREIARGISEDRRFRAPEVASCLRRLPIGALKVPAPGANVGVRVAMNLP